MEELENIDNTEAPESPEAPGSDETPESSEAPESDEASETSESSEEAEAEAEAKTGTETESEAETETETETETGTETETESETEIDIEQIINDALSNISASSPEASDYSDEITQLHAETIEHVEKLEAYAKASFTSSVALLVTAMFTAGVTIGHSFWSRLRGG